MSDQQTSGGLIAVRLSIMMFVQFFIWGAWYVTGPNFLGPLGFSGPDFGNMYSAGPIAGIISPLFIGMIADRFFNVERVLAVMHFGAAAAMYFATTYMQAEDPNPNMINLMFFVHMLFYFPTLGLVNTLAMRNMTNTEKQFPLIRVLGTIGWIVAGLTISFFGWDTKISMFYLATGASLFMGFYCLTLPSTPPVPSDDKPTIAQLFGLEALVMLKRPSFAIFMLCSFLICIPLAFYYQMASRVVQQADLVPGVTMSYGQMSEIVFMLIMPIFFARLGVKWMLAVGMLAWVVRYALFAIGAPDQVVWMIIGGVLLHGICYDFFFVTGQIYTDKAAPPAIRGQAQGMLVLFTLGLGMFIGAQLGGQVEARFTPVETGRLQTEAAAAGNAAGAASSELANLMIDENGIKSSAFDDYQKASAAAFSGTDARAKYLDEFMEKAGAATKPIQEQIDGVYERLDSRIAEINKALTEQLSVVDSKRVNLSGPPAQSLDSISATLTEQSASKINEMSEAAEKETGELLTKKIDAVGQSAADITRGKLTAKGSAPAEGAADAVVLETKATALAHYQQRTVIQALRAMDWKSIWMWPAIGAGVILVFFVIVFKTDVNGRDGETTEEDVAEAAAQEPAP